MQDLDKEEFIKWFKENSPHIGKGKTMENITKAFPDSSFNYQSGFPPYDFILYNTQAAKIMNELKESGKIKTYKKGNTYCYEWIEEDLCPFYEKDCCKFSQTACLNPKIYTQCYLYGVKQKEKAVIEK